MEQLSQRQYRLINALAEQLKLPLLQIARRAELSNLVNDSQLAISEIEQIANGSLRLIESYILSVSLERAHDFLRLEPVSVSAVMNDAAHQLAKVANQYDCQLELHLSGKYEPIMAHREALEAALTCLGHVLIEAQTAHDQEHKPVVKLGAHRSRLGIVAGAFADNEGLSGEVYRRARSLYGLARQPLGQLSAASGAGVFVADSLLGSMSAKLRVARHQKLTGLAATFAPSHQLTFV